MKDTIYYVILPNPLPDAEGNTTYQVRHIPTGTMNEKEFLAHLKYHGTYDTIAMQSSLSVLKNEIIEQLKSNQDGPEDETRRGGESRQASLHQPRRHQGQRCGGAGCFLHA